MRSLSLFACLLFGFCISRTHLAQGTTAFTYQGQLRDDGANASGVYTMTFGLFDTATGGSPIGNAITNEPTLVNGVFSVDLDFGPSAFTGAARWLEINIDGETLMPRVQILPSPYALFARRAGTVFNNAIGTDELANNAVATENIQANAVTADKLGSSSVTADKLASSSVGESHIQTNAVTSDKLAIGAVTNPLIATNAVATENIQTNAVTADKLASSSVGQSHIQTNAVTSDKLATGVVTTKKLADAAVTHSKLAANAVAIENIQDGAVTDAKIVSVESSKVLGPVPFATSATFADSATFATSATRATSASQLVVGDWIVETNTATPGIATRTGALVFSTYGLPRFGVDKDGFGAAVWGSFRVLDDLIAEGGITTPDLSVHGNISADGIVYANSFSSQSDRELKTNFVPIDGEEVLERVANLPISSWSFKKDEGTRHVGPMAQDFYASFKVGGDDKHIATVDADGVALAAIQGLNKKLSDALKEKDARIDTLEKRLAALEQQLAVPPAK